MSEISASGPRLLGADSNLNPHNTGEQRDYETQAPGLLISLKPGTSDIIPQNLNLNMGLKESSFSQCSGQIKEEYPVKEEPYEPHYSTSSNFIHSHERPPFHGRTSHDHFRSMEPLQESFQQVSMKQEDSQHDSLNANAGMGVLESNQGRYYPKTNGDSSADKGNGGEGHGRGEWQASSRHVHRQSRDLGNDVERHRQDSQDECRNEKSGKVPNEHTAHGDRWTAHCDESFLPDYPLIKATCCFNQVNGQP